MTFKSSAQPGYIFVHLQVPPFLTLSPRIPLSQWEEASQLLSVANNGQRLCRFHISVNKTRGFFPFWVGCLWSMPWVWGTIPITCQLSLQKDRWHPGCGDVWFTSWTTMHKLLWILKDLLPLFPFACFGYSRVFPRDRVNVLFPTTHASGIDSELFWAFPGICSRQKTCWRLQWSQPTQPRASHACAVSASSLGLAAPAVYRPWGICFPPHLFLDWSAWVGSTIARTQISGALCM